MGNPRLKTASWDFAEIFDVLIEKTKAGYCLVYRMKFPLWGEVVDCDGQRKALDVQVGYVDTALRADDAWRLACEATAKTSGHCELMWTVLYRDSDEALKYHVVIGVGNSWASFQISAISRDVTFIERSSSPGQITEIMNRLGRPSKLCGMFFGMC
jgi:hypothetical protein